MQFKKKYEQGIIYGKNLHGYLSTIKFVSTESSVFHFPVKYWDCSASYLKSILFMDRENYKSAFLEIYRHQNDQFTWNWCFFLLIKLKLSGQNNFSCKKNINKKILQALSCTNSIYFISCANLDTPLVFTTASSSLVGLKADHHEHA